MAASSANLAVASAANPHLLSPSPTHEHGSRWSALRAVLRTSAKVHTRTEVSTVEGFRRYLDEHQSLSRLTVVGLDLRDTTEAILSVPVNESVFVGCEMDPRALTHIASNKGMVFPNLDVFPYRPFRTSMYTAEELMQGYDASRKG
jgi:hypothetical protein